MYYISMLYRLVSNSYLCLVNIVFIVCVINLSVPLYLCIISISVMWSCLSRINSKTLSQTTFWRLYFCLSLLCSSAVNKRTWFLLSKPDSHSYQILCNNLGRGIKNAQPLSYPLPSSSYLYLNLLWLVALFLHLN